MGDAYIGEIRMFGCNFAPRGWATCDGQLLSISQNTALFSLLGTFYGGDGRTTFALPDLRGRAPMSLGQGPGLSPRDIGEPVGVPAVTLIGNNHATHTHQMAANSANATLVNPTQSDGSPVSVARSVGGFAYKQNPVANNLKGMAPQTVSMTGNAIPHNNVQPYQTVLFCLCMQGVYPPRG